MCRHPFMCHRAIVLPSNHHIYMINYLGAICAIVAFMVNLWVVLASRCECRSSSSKGDGGNSSGEDKGSKERLWLQQQGGMYTLKLWVKREGF